MKYCIGIFLICLISAAHSLSGQSCVSASDTMAGVFPSDTLPDMIAGVPYDVQVRALFQARLEVPPLMIAFDSFGLDPNQVSPPGLQVDCPMNPGYCMAYADSVFIRACYRVFGTPLVQNAGFPGFDSILITGTYRTDIPLLVPISDTVVLYYRILPGSNAVNPTIDGIHDLHIGIDHNLARVTVSYSIRKSETLSFEIWDLGGRLMTSFQQRQTTPGNHQFGFSLSRFSKGIYILHARSSNGALQATRKIVWIP